MDALYYNADDREKNYRDNQDNQDIKFEIVFRGKKIGHYIADIVVEEVIVELKCCKCLLPEHNAQVINYLKAARLTVGHCRYPQVLSKKFKPERTPRAQRERKPMCSVSGMPVGHYSRRRIMAEGSWLFEPDCSQSVSVRSVFSVVKFYS